MKSRKEGLTVTLVNSDLSYGNPGSEETSCPATVKPES